MLNVGASTRLRPNNADISQLSELLNLWSLTLSTQWMYEARAGVRTMLPTGLLQTIVGYSLLEMLVRTLLGGHRKSSDYAGLLSYFESHCPIASLSADLRHLNSVMSHTERGRRLNLYGRLRRGRDQLLHGNVLRTHEGEGELLVLLIDLVVLHVMLEEALLGAA